jgi:hypothetical protein
LTRDIFDSLYVVGLSRFIKNDVTLMQGLRRLRRLRAGATGMAGRKSKS